MPEGEKDEALSPYQEKTGGGPGPGGLEKCAAHLRRGKSREMIYPPIDSDGKNDRPSAGDRRRRKGGRGEVILLAEEKGAPETRRDDY